MYGDYTSADQLADVDFDTVNVYMVQNAKDEVLAVYVYDIPEGVENPSDLTITGVSVLASQGVVYGTNVDDVNFIASVTAVNAGTFNGTITATPAWEKLNEDTGAWEPFDGDVFVVGNYRAKITLNVSDTEYVLTDNTAISYYGQADKTGASFYTDKIPVTNP